MTRKDYVLIAQIVASGINYEKNFNNNSDAQKALEALAITFSDVLAIENPRFDRARFLEACAVLEKAK